MAKFMKEKDINPLKNMAPIFVQVRKQIGKTQKHQSHSTEFSPFQLPIFMSMFLGLRGMANLPVESM